MTTCSICNKFRFVMGLSWILEESEEGTGASKAVPVQRPATVNSKSRPITQLEEIIPALLERCCRCNADPHPYLLFRIQRYHRRYRTDPCRRDFDWNFALMHRAAWMTSNIPARLAHASMIFIRAAFPMLVRWLNSCSLRAGSFSTTSFGSTSITV